jgi:hypothetical protein
MNAEYPPCPECGAADPLPIVFGYPSPEMCEAAERKQIQLGGCVIDENTRSWECRSCRHRYDSPPGYELARRNLPGPWAAVFRSEPPIPDDSLE